MAGRKSGGLTTRAPSCPGIVGHRRGEHRVTVPRQQLRRWMASADGRVRSVLLDLPQLNLLLIATRSELALISPGLRLRTCGGPRRRSGRGTGILLRMIPCQLRHGAGRCAIDDLLGHWRGEHRVTVPRQQLRRGMASADGRVRSVLLDLPQPNLIIPPARRRSDFRSRMIASGRPRLPVGWRMHRGGRRAGSGSALVHRVIQAPLLHPGPELPVGLQRTVDGGTDIFGLASVKIKPGVRLPAARARGGRGARWRRRGVAGPVGRWRSGSRLQTWACSGPCRRHIRAPTRPARPGAEVPRIQSLEMAKVAHRHARLQRPVLGEGAGDDGRPEAYVVALGGGSGRPGRHLLGQGRCRRGVRRCHRARCQREGRGPPRLNWRNGGGRGRGREGWGGGCGRKRLGAEAGGPGGCGCGWRRRSRAPVDRSKSAWRVRRRRAASAAKEPAKAAEGGRRGRWRDPARAGRCRTGRLRGGPPPPVGPDQALCWGAAVCLAPRRPAAAAGPDEAIHRKVAKQLRLERGQPALDRVSQQGGAVGGEQDAVAVVPRRHMQVGRGERSAEEGHPVWGGWPKPSPSLVNRELFQHGRRRDGRVEEAGYSPGGRPAAVGGLGLLGRPHHHRSVAPRDQIARFGEEGALQPARRELRVPRRRN
eukprot:scaffold35989_cov84-Isochrysis_galbana.AAC.3